MSTKQNVCQHVVFSQNCCLVASFVDKTLVDDSTMIQTLIVMTTGIIILANPILTCMSYYCSWLVMREDLQCLVSNEWGENALYNEVLYEHRDQRSHDIEDIFLIKWVFHGHTVYDSVSISHSQKINYYLKKIL